VNIVSDLVVIGHLSYDENRTQCGTKTVLGGSAYYTAVGASLYSKAVRVISKVGNDYDIERLKRLGIDTGDVLIETGNTPRFLQVYNTDGSRSFSGDFGVCEDFSPEYIDDEDVCWVPYVHIGTMPPKQQIKFAEYLIGNGADVSIDTLEQYIEQWPEDVFEAMSAADIIFLNQSQKELFKKLSLLNEKRIVLKKGAEGAEYFSDDEHISVPAPKVDVIDPTGSGDVLAGAFLTLLARDWDPRYALEEAVRTASLSVTDFGVDFLLDKIKYR